MSPLKNSALASIPQPLDPSAIRLRLDPTTSTPASPEPSSESDITALSLARNGSHLEVVRLLEEHQ